MRTTVLAFCFLLSATTQATAQSRPKDEAAIRAGVAAYEAGVNARDASAIAKVFTPDADLVVFDSPRVIGRDSIAKLHSDGLASWPPTRKFSLEVKSIRYLGAELALVETQAQFSEGEMQSNRGTILMSKRGGEWQWAALRVYPAEKQ